VSKVPPWPPLRLTKSLVEYCPIMRGFAVYTPSLIVKIPIRMGDYPAALVRLFEYNTI
jgi:hypothetical protein